MTDIETVDHTEERGPHQDCEPGDPQFIHFCCLHLLSKSILGSVDNVQEAILVLLVFVDFCDRCCVAHHTVIVH